MTYASAAQTVEARDALVASALRWATAYEHVTLERDTGADRELYSAALAYAQLTLPVDD